ncbi:MAG: hypothetical protein U0R80_09125 [Nocardioidaceae bacterium]
MADQQPDDVEAAPETAARVPDDTAFDAPPETRRRRLPSRRTAVAGLALAGVTAAGFGGGYLVGHVTGGSTDQLQMTGFDRGTHQGPPDGMSGQAPGQGDQGGQGGTTGQSGEQPDFDGDGQPDTGSGTTDDGSSDDSTTS